MCIACTLRALSKYAMAEDEMADGLSTINVDQLSRDVNALVQAAADIEPQYEGHDQADASSGCCQVSTVSTMNLISAAVGKTFSFNSLFWINSTTWTTVSSIYITSNNYDEFHPIQYIELSKWWDNIAFKFQSAFAVKSATKRANTPAAGVKINLKIFLKFSKICLVTSQNCLYFEHSVKAQGLFSSELSCVLSGNNINKFGSWLLAVALVNDIMYCISMIEVHSTSNFVLVATASSL